MTLRKLAQLANVSVSTVSKALNGSHETSEATISKIFGVAEENGFFLSKQNKPLKRKTNNIALIFSREMYLNPHARLTPITLQEDFMRILQEKGYTFTLNVSRTTSGHSTIRQLSYQSAVDGFIIISDDITDREIQLLEQLEIPYVFADVKPDNIQSEVPYFIDDNYYGGVCCTNYLIEMGFKKIATITNINDSIYRLRTDGYCDTMIYAGLEPHIIHFSMIHDDCEELIHEKMEELKSYDALFVQWDGVAGVLMQLLIDKGIKVPEDISIVGYNDYFINSYFRPRLTTFRDSRKIICEESLNYLMNKIKDFNCPITQKVLKGHMVERESVRSLRTKK